MKKQKISLASRIKVIRLVENGLNYDEVYFLKFI
jgi:hypothetical protein